MERVQLWVLQVPWRVFRNIGTYVAGSATIPSTHSDRLRISEQTAHSLTSLIINKKEFFQKTY